MVDADTAALVATGTRLPRPPFSVAGPGPYALVDATVPFVPSTSGGASVSSPSVVLPQSARPARVGGD